MSLIIDACPADFPIDEVYSRLVAMGADRSEEETRAMLSALILILINQIKEPATVFAAIDLVARTFDRPEHRCALGE